MCKSTDKGYCPQCDMVVELWGDLCACERNESMFAITPDTCQCDGCVADRFIAYQESLIDTDCGTVPRINGVCPDCHNEYRDCECPLPF